MMVEWYNKDHEFLGTTDPEAEPPENALFGYSIPEELIDFVQRHMEKE